jgi:glyoxylase I family protein
MVILLSMALRGLHHVQLNVADVAESVSFFQALGMTVRADRPDIGIDGAWLDVGDQQVHLLLAPTPADVGQHFALEVDDLDGVVAALRARGAEVGEPRSLGAGLARQTSLRDPSGNRIELREPPQ